MRWIKTIILSGILAFLVGRVNLQAQQFTGCTNIYMTVDVASDLGKFDWNGSIEQSVRDLVARTNQVYERVFGIRVILLKVNIYKEEATDPYKGVTSGTYVSIARSLHDAEINVSPNEYDLIVMFSLTQFDPGAGGRAFGNAPRSDNGLRGYYYTTSQFNDQVFMHELAHDLGAGHCDAECLNAADPADNCNPPRPIYTNIRASMLCPAGSSTRLTDKETAAMANGQALNFTNPTLNRDPVLTDATPFSVGDNNFHTFLSINNFHKSFTSSTKFRASEMIRIDPGVSISATPGKGLAMVLEDTYGCITEGPPFDIKNVTATPTMQAPNTAVNVTFDYVARIPGGVRVEIMPVVLSIGSPTVNVTGSTTVYTSFTGSGQSTFSVGTPGGTISQVQFKIIDNATSLVLYKELVDIRPVTIGNFGNYEILNTVPQPPTLSVLRIGDYVTINFDYISQVSGTRITISPYKGGAPVPNQSTSSSPVYMARQGSGSAYFTLNAVGTVDQVRFQIINNANNAVLYTKYINVNYTFINYDIFNVVAEGAGCDNKTAFVSFDYTAPIYNSEKIDLKVTVKYKGGNPPGIAMPTFLADGLNTTSSHLSARYELSSAVVNVDQVIFQFYNSNGVLLREVSKTVNFNYQRYGVSNFTTVPADKAQPGQSIAYSMQYYHPATAGLKIVAHPFTNVLNTMGATQLLDVIYPTLNTFTGPAGTATGSFTRNEPGIINGYRVYFIQPSTNDTLCSSAMYVPSMFVGDYNIQLPSIYPETHLPGEMEQVTFGYYIRPAQPKTVQIILEPVTSLRFTTTGTTVASSDGTTTLGFTLTQPGQVNQMRFRMKDNVSGQIVFEKLVNVRYTFATTSVRLASDPSPSDQQSIAGESSGTTLVPNPSSGKATLTYRLINPSPVQIGVFDIIGRPVIDNISFDRQEAGEHSVEIRLKEHAAGIYMIELLKEGKRENIRMVLEK